MSAALALLAACGALVAAVALPATGARAQDRTLEQVIVNQSTIIKRFEPPPRRGSVAVNVSGVRGEISEEAASRIRFRLRRVRLEGTTDLAPADLASIYAPEIGKAVSLADVFAITDRIEARYRELGLFVIAIVPKQNYANGDILIQVDDQSFIREVRVTSDIPGIDQRLQPYIDRIVAMRPLREKAIQRQLLLISDLAGVEIEATLVRPDAIGQGGTLILEISGVPQSGVIGLDNRGSTDVGPLQLPVVYTRNDLLRFFETQSLTGVTIPDNPRELLFGQYAVTVPIGTHGLQAGGTVGYIRSEPQGSLASMDVEVQSVFTDAFLTYPVVRTFDDSVFAKASFQTKMNDVDVLGNPATRDRARWLDLGLRSEHSRGSTGLQLSASFLQGLDILDANDPDDPLASGESARPDFNLVRGSFDLSLAPAERFSVAFQAVGQLAFDPVPAAVQFAAGGMPFGRAFDSSAITGDSGLAGSAELAFDTSDFDPTFLERSALYVFADYGAVFSRGLEVNEKDAQIASTGVGVRVAFPRKIAADFMVGFPLQDTRDDDQAGVRAFFSLGKAF